MPSFIDLLLGGTKHKNINLQSPEQQQLFRSALSPEVTSLAGPAYQSFLQPQSVEDQQKLFQQSYIDPAMQALQQQIIPGIQEQFVDLQGGASGALNQALSAAAQQATTQLGSQFGSFFENQQTRQLEALRQLLGLGTQQTFQPMAQQKAGILGPILKGGFDIASAYAGNPALATRGFFGRGGSG